jgi:hypothetical protein
MSDGSVCSADEYCSAALGAVCSNGQCVAGREFFSCNLFSAQFASSIAPLPRRRRQRLPPSGSQSYTHTSTTTGSCGSNVRLIVSAGHRGKLSSFPLRGWYASCPRSHFGGVMQAYADNSGKKGFIWIHVDSCILTIELPVRKQTVRMKNGVHSKCLQVT